MQGDSATAGRISGAPTLWTVRGGCSSVSVKKVPPFSVASSASCIDHRLPISSTYITYDFPTACSRTSAGSLTKLNGQSHADAHATVR